MAVARRSINSASDLAIRAPPGRLRLGKRPIALQLQRAASLDNADVRRGSFIKPVKADMSDGTY